MASAYTNRKSSLFLISFMLLLVKIGQSSATMIDEDLLCVRVFLQQVSSNESSWAFIKASSVASSSKSSSGLRAPSRLVNEEGSTFEIQCSPIALYGGQLRVTALLLEGMQLAGPFPPLTIGNLTSLVRLSLFNNSLSGRLPTELWQLSQLRYLSLSHNHFTGEIPAGISSLSKLDRLDFTHNALSGALSVEISQLRNLQYLYLSSNMFAHAASALAMLRLRVLNVSHNQLGGLLVSSNPSALASLKTLDMSYNTLSGPLSNLSQHLISIVHLDLSHNMFTDNVSALLLSSSLQWLDLSSNKLIGDPSLSLPRLFDIVHLSLAQNELASNSLEWVLSSKHLEFLNFSSSRLARGIPHGIGNLMNLTQIDLSHNELSGSIPSSMSNLHSLSYLDLSYNNMDGGASTLMTLTSLKYLNFSYNNLSACATPSLKDRFGPGAFRGLCERPIAANLPHFTGKHFKRHVANVGIIAGILAGGVLLCSIVIAGGLLAFKREFCMCEKSSSSVFMSTKMWPPGGGGVQNLVSGPFSFETDAGVWLANVKNPTLVPVIIFEKPLLNLTFADLLRATSNFCEGSQLSEGGFGPVYRANLAHGHLDVTIKVLIEGRVLSDHKAAREFEALSRIKHTNLLPLLGFCLVGDERLVLYQYMGNAGLHRWLHDLPIGMHLNDFSRDLQWEGPTDTDIPTCGALASWARRHKIALGIARALAFLHHGHFPQIVHRDVKASNVMLDYEFEPCLANTGLVQLLATSDECVAQSSSSTPGYAPPEYSQAGRKVNAKGDVYSYGVVLIELMTGKRPMGDVYNEGYTGDNVVGWLRVLMKEKRTHMALDPRILLERGPNAEMLEALRIGYLCTAEIPSKRPTMHQVVGLLKDIEPQYFSL